MFEKIKGYRKKKSLFAEHADMQKKNTGISKNGKGAAVPLENRDSLSGKSVTNAPLHAERSGKRCCKVDLRRALS